ncbi:MAG: hypothetical protein WD894_05925 [Pirellulales bacterium]
MSVASGHDVLSSPRHLALLVQQVDSQEKAGGASDGLIVTTPSGVSAALFFGSVRPVSTGGSRAANNLSHCIDHLGRQVGLIEVLESV